MVDTQSQTWFAVKAHAEKRLAVHLKMLEGKRDHEETTFLRGQITELRAFLALGVKPEPTTESEPAGSLY